MNSTVQPPLPPSVLPGIKEALGCITIGTVLSTGVYGISVLQAYLYLRNGARDPISMRCFVTLVFVLDTLSVILAVKGLYEYVVTDFGNPWLLLKVPPILALENGVTVLIGVLTQCFFAHRIWALSRGNMVLGSGIVILALCAFGPGVGISVNLYTHQDIYFLGSTETRVLSGIANGLSVICDVAIAVALCYYLHTRRTGFKRTDLVIDQLMLYAVNRGALTAICQACHMITTVALPGRFLFIPFVRLEGKLYCNTLLATLNAREALRGDGMNTMELSSRILNSMNTSSSPGHGRHTGGHGLTETGSDGMRTIVIGISTVKSEAVDHTSDVERDA